MAQATQQIIWTCLPNGTERGRALRFSVLVSPRLVRGDGPATIEPFENWLDWPETIARSNFRVSINGQDRPVTLVSRPKTSVWQALFPASTFLKSFAFDDLSGKLILSYPVAAMERHIRRAYQEFAVSMAADLPTLSDFAPFARPFGGRRQDKPTLLKRLQKEGSAGFGRSFEDSLELLTTYHQPLEALEVQSYTNKGPEDPQPSVKWPAPKLTALPKPDEFKQLIDFHQIVSSLNQYPELLRLCGLVLDFTTPADIADGDLDLVFKPDWPHAGSVKTLPDSSPITACRLHNGEFFARPAPGDEETLVGRWLRLNAKMLSLVQLDVDGAGLKVKNFANSVTTNKGDVIFSEDAVKEDVQSRRTGAPALRSGGLTLAQSSRDVAIKAMFTGATKLQKQFVAGQELKLFARDLLRGYRPDIWAERTGKWHSLCRRDAHYTLVKTGEVIRSADEEGTVRLGTTAAADGSNPDVMKAHEGLFVWRGWSLCAPLPMRAIDPDDTVGDGDNAAPEGLPLETDFDPRAGSLPTLRFGQAYRVRVRLVDLAGNSVSFGDAAKPPAAAMSVKTVYQRYEPVEAPALALVGPETAADEPADGESMGRLAIRTFNDKPEKNAIPISDVARRHIFPPRVTHLFAELHGALDTAEGRPNPELWSLLTVQDEPLRSVDVKTSAWHAPGAPEPQPVLTPYACAEAKPKLPYLPDPMARAVAIRVLGLDHVDPEKVTLIDLYPGKAKWPHALPFKVQLAEGNAQPKFDKVDRIFLVPLDKAERAQLRISCIVPEDGLETFAIWSLIRDKGLTASGLDRLRKQVLRGQHWMLTPWRDVDLVHAVQKPLVEPRMQGFSGALPNAFRYLNELDARLGFSTPLHAKSTGRLDLFGRWQEASDLAATAGPASQASEAHAQSWTIARLGHPDRRFAERDAPHVFSDTRYRRVFYRLEATTRFREYMPPALRAVEESEPLKLVSSEQRLWIPNSAPPPAPAIVYVLPTFGWSRSRPAAGGSGSWRRGGGLRVYLDRPWFASGHGEMLGVLLPKESATIGEIEGALKPFVTQWGADPAWLGGRVERPAPRVTAFPLRRLGAPVAFPGAPAEFQDEGADLPRTFETTDLTVPGAGVDVRVDVVPHGVGFDPERKLWYCDIVVDPGDAYFAFIRLALARYHPVSAPGAHLSPVALADFQQLAPDRYLTVSPGTTSTQRKFALYGRTGFRTLGGAESGRVTVELQALDAGAEESLDWRRYVPPDAPAVLDWSPRASRLLEGQIRLRSLAQSGDAVARTARQLADRQTAMEMNEAGRFEELVSQAGLLNALLPPLIYEGEIRLPANRAGRRFRLLVTESELHLTGERDGTGAAPTAERIVYAEAIEL